MPKSGNLSSVLALVVALPAAASDGALHTPNIREVAHVEFDFATGLVNRGNVMVAGAMVWDGRSADSGIHVFNTGNPGEPKRLSFTNCAGYQAVVGIAGTTIVQAIDATSSNDNCDPGRGKEGVRIYDASDLGAPRSIAFAETIHGAHTVAVDEHHGLVYVSSYALTSPASVDGVSIVDINDPANPTVTFLEFPDADNSPDYPDLENRSGMIPTSPGCHEISFDHTSDLAFCAGITETQIWDVSNPRAPVIISIIVNPLINIHHGAHVSHVTPSVLVIGDEWAGALGGPSSCVVEGAPVGSLWFYDVSDPLEPVLLSYWAPPDPMPTANVCTSHDFDPFDDRDWLVTAWYDHGLYVIDFTDPTNPTMVARYRKDGAMFWHALATKGYLYATSAAPIQVPAGTDQSKEGAGGVYVYELDGYTRSDN